MIAMVIISGTELSILKATRELGRLAWSSLLSAVILAAVSIPSYIIGGTRAIIPALLVSTFLTLAVHLRFTLPLFPWRSNPFSWATLVKGSDLIRLSLSFILANIIASAAEFALRSIMANGGDINDVGLYSAGLVITVVASRFLFVAMDADYFPSLSGVCNSVSKTNLIANRQLEICVLLITPFLIISNLFMPLIIRILYTPDFMTIRPMVICASFYMFFKAINTPVAYIALAKNDGRTYLCMEVAYSVAFLLLVTTFYKLWGITGSGIALSLANLFEMLMVSVCYHRLYHFAYSRRAILLIFCQGLLLAAGITVVILWDGIGGHVAGTIAALASVTLSLRTLMRRSGIKGILHRRTNTAD
jgi:O-antigen/teichoic acid export membrane protein